MFQRRYVGEEDWVKVTKKVVSDRLKDWYQDVEKIIKDMKDVGVTARTPFAEYRWIEDKKNQ